MRARWVPAAILASLLGAAPIAACRSTPIEGPAPDRRPEASSGGFPGAAECADCHADIVAEWQSSAHAFSAENPLIHAPVCGRCHAPVGTMLDPEFMYRYAEAPPPASLPAAAAEGVSCVVCHAPIELADPQPLHFEPEWPNWRTSDLALRVLDFDRALGPFGSGLGDDAPPVHQDYHASGFEPGIQSAELCRSCHELVVDKGPLEAQLGGPQPRVTLDRTYAEWAASAYPARGTTCQTCHMPRRPALEPAAVAPPGQAFDAPPPPRPRSDHGFPGVHGSYWREGPELALQQRRVTALLDGIVSIELELAPAAARGETLEIVARLRNEGVGHDLPSGYAFWRELWLELRVEDATGRLLFGSGALDADAFLMDEYNPAVRQDPRRYDPYLWSLRARMVRSPKMLAAWIDEDRQVQVPDEAIRRNLNGTPILSTADFDASPILAQAWATDRGPDGSAGSTRDAGPLEEVYTLRYGEAVIANGIPAGETRQARYPVPVDADAVGPLRVSARLLLRPLSRSMTSQQEELAASPPPGPTYTIESAEASIPIAER
ncbi:MAG: hypothetical protein H6648_07600 [Caldilineae bacterium]|nr:hypothetical protein [Chloroflexota bacterium]MCB9177008.1 hypothetical protein [Caldilineae bacterium]